MFLPRIEDEAERVPRNVGRMKEGLSMNAALRWRNILRTNQRLRAPVNGAKRVSAVSWQVESQMLFELGMDFMPLEDGKSIWEGK